jgi:hypothetical protein
VTGLLNATVPDDCKIEDDEAGVYTECAHIIPEATFFNADPKSEDNTKVCANMFDTVICLSHPMPSSTILPPYWPSSDSSVLTLAA